MFVFLRIVAIMGKYGWRATNWCWNNKGKILAWISAGQGIDWIVSQIRRTLGV